MAIITDTWPSNFRGTTFQADERLSSGNVALTWADVRAATLRLNYSLAAFSVIVGSGCGFVHSINAGAAVLSSDGTFNSAGSDTKVLVIRGQSIVWHPMNKFTLYIQAAAESGQTGAISFYVSDRNYGLDYEDLTGLTTISNVTNTSYTTNIGGSSSASLHTLHITRPAISLNRMVYYAVYCSRIESIGSWTIRARYEDP